MLQGDNAEGTFFDALRVGQGVHTSCVMFKIPEGLVARPVKQEGSKNGTGFPLDPESFLSEDQRPLKVVPRVGNEETKDA